MLVVGAPRIYIYIYIRVRVDLPLLGESGSAMMLVGENGSAEANLVGESGSTPREWNR